MGNPTAGPLKPPRSKGFMSANMVLPLYDVLVEHVGFDAAQDLYRNAGLRYLPEPEDPVREKLVCDVHHAVRESFPNRSQLFMKEAGERAADVVVTYRIPASAQRMLRRLPWPLATWMLKRSAEQISWTYGGSARFDSDTTAEFALVGNPSVRSDQAHTPICVFHATLFQSLFRRLVHPEMICAETQCEACGHDACRFVLSVPSAPQT